MPTVVHPFRPSVSVKGYKTTAKVMMPDVPAGASIVHVVDKVLVPQLA
jgi:uncharacterized surface protein with fasciclin (FAS1) repeats